MHWKQLCTEGDLKVSEEFARALLRAVLLALRDAGELDAEQCQTALERL